MNLILRQSMAVIAAAVILAYMGLISLSHLRDYVAWPADMLALSIVAALCGMLLALAESKALHLYLIASVVSALLFGGFWAYATWGVLGSSIPLVELLFSDLVLLYAVQRSFLLVTPCLVFGLLGVLGVQLLLPKILRR
jgi:hypothetical protein